jgi:hypothetical protein
MPSCYGDLRKTSSLHTLFAIVANAFLPEDFATFGQAFFEKFLQRGWSYRPYEDVIGAEHTASCWKPNTSHT